jgi:uncharacterized protein YcgI (DUF1989 family)
VPKFGTADFIELRAEMDLVFGVAIVLGGKLPQQKLQNH